MIAWFRARFYGSRAFRSCVVWGVLLFILWLDRDRRVLAHQEHVFAFVIAGLKFLWDVVQTVGTAIAISLEAIVSWLVAAFGWLAGVVAHLMKSTGAIFAKAWQGLKIVWNDVLKPTIRWVDKAITRLHDWLKRTLKPLITFLRSVKDHIDSFYKKFVRPILDTIDFVHQLNRVLTTFHLNFLQKIDATLQKFESYVNARFEWVYARINLAQDWINSIIDGGGLFQRWVFLRTLERDVMRSWQILFNARAGEISAEEMSALRGKNKPPSFRMIQRDFETYLRTGGGPYANDIDVTLAMAKAYAAAPELGP